MDKQDWTYLLAIVVLALVTVLGVFNKLSAEDLMKVFMLIIGAFLGIGAGYAMGRLKERRW